MFAEQTSEAEATHDAWGVWLEGTECFEDLRLSFSTWSVGLHRNEFQGAQPPPPATPIINGARVSLLRPGQSFFTIPEHIRGAVQWRFLPTTPARPGQPDLLNRDRAWCLIQLMGQLETPHRDAYEIRGDHALSVRHQTPSTISVASRELETSNGCPPQ